ncbi:MAG: DoxX family membrane protein [Xanthobacteraceae bacterium]
MVTLGIGLTALIRIFLVLLFLPFSALDKVLDFRTAVAQAREAIPNNAGATALILAGLFVEVVMSAGVVSGIADRVCAFVLAGYCGVTALLWKQFWVPGDFWTANDGKARALFWDFWKNLALGAGFLLIVFGTNATAVSNFLAHPTISTHPYRVVNSEARP